MPLYEYECDACGHRFEMIRKFSDEPLIVCPKCGGTLRKLFSSPAIQFKGSGFYITDYAKKDTSAAGKANAASDAAGEKSEKSEKSDAAKTDGAKSEKSDTTKSESSSSSSSETTSSKPTPSKD